MTIATATLPTPVIGVAYSRTIATTGGTLPIAFSISAGILPTGLTLNAGTGASAGTPTTAGAYTFTVHAVDAAAQVTSQTYSGTLGAVPSLSALSPSSGPVAGGTSVTITGTAFTGATAVLFGSTPATSTWAVPPAITGISPDSGAFAGGTVVTITESGFTHATAVYLGSTPRRSA